MGNKDMLVISAHAADYCTRAGGTIARYKRKGWKIHIITLTYGARGESGNYWKEHPGGTVEECEAIRKNESTKAAHHLGPKIEFLGISDYPLNISDKTLRVLTKRILDIRPQIILTHWMIDPLNLDHEVTGHAVVRAVSSAAQLGAFPNTPAHYFPELYCFESTVPHSEFNDFKPDIFIDISETFHIKMEAIRLFECQLQLQDYYTHFATHRGFQASDWVKRPVKYAEAFKKYFPYVGTTFNHGEKLSTDRL